MKLWLALRIIVRDREWRMGMKLLALVVLMVAAFVLPLALRIFSYRHPHLPSTWWFYVLFGVGVLGSMIIILRLDKHQREHEDR